MCKSSIDNYSNRSVFYCMCFFFFFFKQKTAYEMRISDWSSDVCSSDLTIAGALALLDSALPKPPPKQETLNGIGPLMDLLKVMLKLRCEEHDVAQKLVASSAHLAQTATRDAPDVLARRGCRYEVFGRADRQSPGSAPSYDTREGQGGRREIK